MKNWGFKLFLVCLFVYSIVIIQTMYIKTFNFAVDDTLEETLFGIRLPYYMGPLFLVNIGIIVTNISKLPKNTIGILLMIWGVYLTFNVLFLSQIIYIDFIRVNLWITSYFASYIFIRKEPNRIHTVIRMFCLVFVISTIYYVLSKISQKNYAETGLETSSNIVFCVLTVFPWIMLQSNKKITLIFFIITLVAVIFSNKRSATIASALCIIPVIQYYFRNSRINAVKIIGLLLVTIILVIAFEYISNTFLDNRMAERFSSLSEDGGSHRDRIWLYTLNGFQNSSLIYQIIGHGHYKVSLLGQATAAHNDFLEVLYDYGVIGFVIYICIHISIFKRMLFLRKNKDSYASSYLATWIIFFVMSLVSILIVQQRYLIYMGVYWGAIDGLIMAQRRLKNN